MVRNYRLRNGHAPDHVRDAFLETVDAFLDWDAGPQPRIEFEVNYRPVSIPISRACTLVWNCTDIVPGDVFDRLACAGLIIKRRTYAACTRALLPEVSRQAQAASPACLPG